MAALSGKVGKVQYKGNKTLGLRDWSCDIDVGMTDVTSWTTGTEQWRSFVPGLSGAVGTANGFFDPDSTGQEDIRVGGGLSTDIVALTTGTIQLYMDRGGGEHLTGSVYFNAQNFAADIEGTVNYNVSYRFTGAVTFATAT